MPVVNISLSRLRRLLPGISQKRFLEMLPFAGLDIEGADNNVVRVEYNPNRPDFSSDYGIIRALKGLLGTETGIPSIKLRQTTMSVKVDGQTNKVRPYIAALVAKGGSIDDQTIKQLIAMQEDLHDGLGRRRKKASIGIHNLDKIEFPVRYTTAGPDFSFVPLGEIERKTVQQILEETATGKQYRHILGDSDRYPVILDKSGNLLSFPPIINGNLTKVDDKTRSLFVEVTATSSKAADDVLAIVAITLHDAGFDIGSVSVRSGRKESKSPNMETTSITTDLAYVNSILGLELDAKQVVKCLEKSRLGAAASGSKIRCTIPRYRTDLSSPIDIAEEVAVGFGIYDIEPTLPASSTAGSRSIQSHYFDSIRQVLVGLGMFESLGFSLTSSKTEYSVFDRRPQDELRVEGPKSAEHEVLRDSLIPSLLESLSRNVHEEYPQKLFEIGRVFHGGTVIRENWSVAAATAHGDAGYTEIKSYLQTVLGSGLGKSCETVPSPSHFFIPGRSAKILVSGEHVGQVGEVIPFALEELKMRVPVSAFEIDLDRVLGLS